MRFCLLRVSKEEQREMEVFWALPGQVSPGKAEEGLLQNLLIHIQVLWGMRMDRIPTLAGRELCLPPLQQYIFPSPSMNPSIFHSYSVSQQHSSLSRDAWTSSN